ncbi:MAG: hypothetical protein CMJ81_24085 [Planctomycetaceae bacterium]|nr:hypothetical protein [Planctomycetaceae bacterium]MBP62055.1 hypothetical protein [Planctomycetaceae bacterium]
MNRYSGLSDDFYINMNLNTEMELPSSRDSVLHFFDRLQKQYPTMRNFYCRDRNDFVLEEDKESGKYRWSSVELRRVSSGQVNPPTVEHALEQHDLVLDLVPFMLSMSPLDCESLNCTFGFDFTYRGNHNQLVAEALGVVPAFDRLAQRAGATMISHEPSIQFGLADDCRIQCRLSIETRTSAYHVRVGEFPEEQLSVYLTARRYGSLDPGETFNEVMHRLTAICQEMVEEHVRDQVLRPLQETIAFK